MPSKTKTRTTRSGGTVTKTRSTYKDGDKKTVVRNKTVTSPSAEKGSKSTTRTRTVEKGDYGRNKKKTVSQTRSVMTADGKRLESTGTVTKRRTATPTSVARSTRVTGNMKENRKTISTDGRVGRKSIVGAATTGTSRRRIVPKKNKMTGRR
jgi:hypothetical protein